MRARFTLIEMLVVIAIIGILAGMLSGPLLKARRSGHITACKNNLKQCFTAITLYQNAYDQKYPPWLSSTDYGKNRDLFLCPLDDNRGNQGSRPDWITGGSEGKDQYAETNDMLKAQFTTVDAGKFSDDYWDEPYQRPDPDNLTDQHRCSYLYEFNGAKCRWYDGSYGLTDTAPSWQVVKLWEMKSLEGAEDEGNIRPFIPVVRCYYHSTPHSGDLVESDVTLNVRYSGSVGNSPPTAWWKSAPD